MDIIQFEMFEDNYGYLLRDPATGKVVTIDPGDAPVVEKQLDQRGWKLDEIWITHHHGDHAGGNLALKKKYGCKVFGPQIEANQIPGVDVSLSEGDTLTVGESAKVLDVGGHTVGHIAYYFASLPALFCGDAVFGLGCGRLFEGTAEQMWGSLVKISVLPGNTLIYCAHEYFLSNAPFALSVDPQNVELQKRIARGRSLRAADQPTVPMRLEEELDTNPFFRPLDSQFMDAAFPGVPRVQAFAELRKQRNTFRA